MAVRKDDGSQVVELLRNDILSGALKPRERLIETSLAEKYLVSRTPVREAIKQLEAEGLVERQAYKGAVVSDVGLEERLEMRVVRISLEGLAASLATKYLQDEDLMRLETFEREIELAAQAGDMKQYVAYNEYFHTLIYRSSHNRVLCDTITQLLKRSAQSPEEFWRVAENTQLTIHGHRELLKALGQRDAERARICAEKHVMDTAKAEFSASPRKNSSLLDLEFVDPNITKG